MHPSRPPAGSLASSWSADRCKLYIIWATLAIAWAAAIRRAAGTTSGAVALRQVRLRARGGIRAWLLTCGPDGEGDADELDEDDLDQLIDGDGDEWLDADELGGDGASLVPAFVPERGWADGTN